MSKEIIKIGDYVLASMWSDCDPKDPWRIGFVVRINEYKTGKTYTLGLSEETDQFSREFPCAKKITPKEGKEFIHTHTIS